ncbi:SDR family oxidoreductase [Streptomyces malaysiensis]|uniref:3-oxoacyl-ACP reductase n=2 Tax=Streptomyces TaxID=1883 RepID=A0ABM6H5N9_9ACTN|nr:SDR family NAD(P)-dependent oxidoreductase [Streptomyces autolyticus]AQA09215.1 3-oxoacyl-ACP reductase [Streptomyces autolyticus]
MEPTPLSPSGPDDADLFSVHGRTAVVTGGSRGIGAMIARGLARDGAQVVIASRKADQCRAAAEAINASGVRGHCTAIPADLSSPEGCQRLAAWLAEHHHSVDILVNNAGTTWGAPLEAFPTAGWTKVLGTNLIAPFDLTVGILPLLRRAGRADRPARVINIGSVDGINAPLWENYSYSAGKAGLHMLTRHLAKRLAAEHITVNAIAPGPFLTDMLGHVAADQGVETELLARVPLGRYGLAGDIVGAVRFLASRAGAYVTAAVIPLDGGITGCSG